MADSHAGDGGDEMREPAHLSSEVGVAVGEEQLLEGGGGGGGDELLECRRAYRHKHLRHATLREAVSNFNTGIQLLVKKEKEKVYLY